jgi:hypothetical protein
LSQRNFAAVPTFLGQTPCGLTRSRNKTMRGILLWLIGIPIPIILLLWLFGVLH